MTNTILVPGRGLVPRIFAAASLACLAACGGAPAWPAPPDAAAGELTSAEEDAVAAYDALRARPDDEVAIIWYGRRLGYLGRYEDAIAVYTRGLEVHRASPRLLRHRGHRHISLRCFDEAVADFEAAVEAMVHLPDEVEPDGIPNERHQPTSTLHTNVWYHLGLARFCRGEYDEAVRCYQACLAAAKNPDMESAARYWLFHAATRVEGRPLGGEVLIPVREDWDIIENHAYHRLLLLYRGDLDLEDVAVDTEDAVQDATLAYGLARYRFLFGDDEEGVRLLREVADLGTPAFGVIAAEADLRLLEER